MTITSLTDAELDELSTSFESRPAADVVAWAVANFGQELCLTTSLTDAVLVDVALSVDPTVEVVFIDTGFHFPETMDILEQVRRRYSPNLRVLRSSKPLDDLWRRDTDACCAVRKVAQLDEALDGKRAWMSGLRRADAPNRASTPIIQRDRRGLVKINPLATWSDEYVDSYIAERNVPVNPLVAQGFPSVGCWPCTRAIAEGEDPRAGRWAGTSKTECGLHL
ncbi:MAG: phosphoadenylylsulfate reductase (thioredoxin) [Acidimicrobiia bacterium]|nr:phosphoadenylylsulfate reductase (thioredoxin) [Acidimicrobiia bacterium]